MTSVAKVLLAESDALSLATAIDGVDDLAALPVSLGEAAAGQWQVVVYLTESHETNELTALSRVAATLFGKSAPQFSIEDLPDIDWVAKSLEGLPPVRAGRFLIHGSHNRDARHPNDIAIEIEAGQAFGTGHHGTTAGCLLAIDRIARAGPVLNALDVGTGSGVLAIAIARVTKAPVLASDIDPVAIRVARENVRLNGVERFVRAVIAAGLRKRVFLARAPYDLVVANILAGPLVGLAPQIRSCVAPAGHLILSGLLPEQCRRIVATYRGQGLPLLRAFVLDGWLTLIFRRGVSNHKGRGRQLRPS